VRDEILKLKGEAADAFLKYDSKKLTDDEKRRNKRSYSYYLNHCKCEKA